MGLRVWSLLGTSLSLNPEDSSVQWSSEPKWRRGTAFSPFDDFDSLYPSCLREPKAPSSHFLLVTKTEPQVRKESQSPKGLSTVKCVSKWDVFGKHDASIILERKSYINILKEQSINLSPLPGHSVFLNSLCVLYTPADEGQVGGVSVTCFVWNWEGSHAEQHLLQASAACHQQCQLCLVYRAVLWWFSFTVEATTFPTNAKALIHCEYSRNHNRLFSRSIHSRAK